MTKRLEFGFLVRAASRNRARAPLLAMLVVLLCLVVFFNARTRVYVHAASADFSKSFKVVGEIANGSLVTLDSSASDTVQIANIEDTDKLIGVVVASNNSLLEVDPTISTKQVALSGSTNVLVSTFNGPIIVGDGIAISSLGGIGAKANNGDKIIGFAQADFNGSGQNSIEQEVERLDGSKLQVQIGSVPVVISIGVMASGSKLNKGGIQGWFSQIVGKNISFARIALCAAIAVITIASIVAMLGNAIKVSIQSAGRNPLAKPVIFEALAQVMAMVILVATIGIAIMYAVLRI